MNIYHTFILDNAKSLHAKEDRYIVRITDRVYKQMSNINKNTSKFYELESSSREAINLLTGEKRWFPALFIWYCVNEGIRLE